MSATRQYAFDPIKLAELLGIPPAERDALLRGNEHPYHCRCEVCKEWWRLMGPDPDTRNCGPFSFEELGLNPADYEFLWEEEDVDPEG